MGYAVICRQCKKEFTVFNYRKTVAKFCSKHCVNKFTMPTEEARKRGIKGWGKNKGLKWSLESRLKSSELHKKISARDGIWNKGLIADKDSRVLSKDRHYKWKGGITPQDILQRKKFKRLIQKNVFERDNYTCQMCGAKEDLQVDHIQSWSEYVELRFDINNCRTLCKSCHYEITYGKKIPDTKMPWGHNLDRRVLQ